MSVGRRVRRLLEQTIHASTSARVRVGSDSVFVLGGPRTGATDLAYALAENPEFWTGGEANFFYSLVGANANGRSKLHEAYLRAGAHGPGPGEYREFAAHLGRGLERLFLSRSRGRRWIDCAHENVLVAEELAFLFPTARFVHLVRDGRAVVRSAWGARAAWAPDARSASATWAHFTRAGLRFEQRFPERVLRVEAESLVESPFVVTAAIQEFLEAAPSQAPARRLQRLGLSWYYADQSPDEEGRWPAFDVPADGGWRTWSGEDRAAFTDAAGDVMRALGYWPSAEGRRAPLADEKRWSLSGGTRR